MNWRLFPKIIGSLGILFFCVVSALAQTSSPPLNNPTTSEQTVMERITTVRETETKVVEHRGDANRVRTVAIFIKNRAENVPDEKVSAMEDLITSRITDSGFHVMSREDTINAVAAFADAGANQGDENLAGAQLDKILSNNTSALRLAQNMGADYLLIASITTFGQDQIEYEGQGIKSTITESKMRISYKILDAAVGGSLTGDVVEVSKKDRTQPGVSIKRDVINDLLNDASVGLADVLGKKVAANKIREGPKDTGLVEFDVVCGMVDLVIPEVVRNESGEYIVTSNKYRVEAMEVTVALDGVVIGTTPGPFMAKPGLSKIRLSREGFKDWEQTISVRNNMTLNVSMQMDEAGHRRWRQNADFLQQMKTDAKLTDAQVKAWEGFAKMLEQSGYRIDYRSDVKVVDNGDRRPADAPAGTTPGN